MKIPFDGIPFLYVGEKELWCHQGPDKYTSTKKKSKEKARREDVSRTNCFIPSRSETG